MSRKDWMDRLYIELFGPTPWAFLMARVHAHKRYERAQGLRL